MRVHSESCIYMCGTGRTRIHCIGHVTVHMLCNLANIGGWTNVHVLHGMHTQGAWTALPTVHIMKSTLSKCI